MLSLLLKSPPRTESRATKVAGFTLTNDSYVAALGRVPTIAGPQISEATALTISVVFCAHDLRANALAMSPHKIFRKLDDGGREEAIDDYRFPIIHRKPNTFMGAKRWRWLMSIWRDTWGNAYCEKEITRGGRLIALWPIHPANVRIRIEKDAVLYDVLAKAGGTKTLTRDEMWHWPGPSDDGIRGMSLVGLARQQLGYTVAAEEYGARFIGNNALPGLMFHTDHKMEPDAKRLWLEKFQEAFGGDEMGSAMIADEGLKPIPIGTMPMKDAQFLELRQFQILEYGRMTHIPAHKLMNLDKATFSNIEHQAIEYVGDAIQPLAESFGEVTNLSIFSPTEQVTLYSELNLDGLLKADSKTRAESLQLQRQNGAINADEWRAIENRNKLPDGQGEIYIVPANMQSLKQVKKIEEQPLPDPDQAPKQTENEPKNDGKEADSRSNDCLKPCFLDAFHRLWKVESDRIAGFRKHYDAEKRIEEFVLGRRDHVEAALLPVISGIGGDLAVILAGLSARHCERLRREAIAGKMETEEARRAWAESEWEALV